MNAIDFLIQEHGKVKSLMSNILIPTQAFEDKQKTFGKLSDLLIRHEKMEETVWYPELKTNDKLYDEIKHLVKEEKDAEKFIKEIKEISDEELWDKKFKKFKDDVEHHATEEETELFPIVKIYYDEIELNKIGKNMLSFKEQY